MPAAIRKVVCYSDQLELCDGLWYFTWCSCHR